MPKTAPTHLRICTFKGLQNLPLYVARQQGFFDAHGLDIEIIYTAGSRPQVAGLASGEYNFIQTAPYKMLNLDNNPASSGLDPTTAPQLVLMFRVRPTPPPLHS